LRDRQITNFSTFENNIYEFSFVHNNTETIVDSMIEKADILISSIFNSYDDIISNFKKVKYKNDKNISRINLTEEGFSSMEQARDMVSTLVSKEGVVIVYIENELKNPMLLEDKVYGSVLV
jgi:preprotein translocase subunit SecA